MEKERIFKSVISRFHGGRGGRTTGEEWKAREEEDEGVR